MILNQLTAFALLSSTHLLGQVVVKTPEEPKVEATEETKPEATKEPRTSETQDPVAAQPAVPQKAEVGAETAAPESTEAQGAGAAESTEKGEEAAAAAVEANGAETSLVPSEPENAPASTSGIAQEPAPIAEAAAPVPLNPRPEGEEERLGKHPVDYEAITYKPGTGVVFTSKDKLFSLGMRLRAQFRADVMSTKVGDADTEVSQVFGIPRARLVFKGHVWDEHITYKTEIAISPRDMGMRDGVPHNTPLFDWYTEITHLRDLSLRMGQYKLLFSRQRVVSSGDLEFVDRSLAQGEFHLDRDIGGHLFSEDLFGLGMFRYYTGFTINEGRDSWEVETVTEDTQASWQYLARIEILPFGDFDDYSEVDFARENKARLSLGAAYAHSENGTRERGYQGATFTDGGTVDNENFTADLMFKWAGLTATGELYLRDGERGSAAPEVPGPDDVALVRKGVGGFGQISYLIPRLPLGFGARYSAFGRGWFDESESSLVDNHELGGQVGWYLAGHNLKLQADYFHLWSDESDSAGDQGRVQLQVAY